MQRNTQFNPASQSTLRQAHSPRLKSPFIASFPWYTPIILSLDSFSLLRTHFPDIKGLITSVEKLEEVAFTSSAVRFLGLRKLLCEHPEVMLARTSSGTERADRFDLLHLLAGYRLLEALVLSLEDESRICDLIVQQSPIQAPPTIPKMDKNLENLACDSHLSKLADWVVVLKRARVSIKKVLGNKSFRDGNKMAGVQRDSAHGKQIQALKMLANLLSMGAGATILCNIQIASINMAFFSDDSKEEPGSLFNNFPVGLVGALKDPKSLIYQHLDAAEIDALRQSFEHMAVGAACYALEASALISPLCLLVPLMVQARERNRKALIQVAYFLGNRRRPACLSESEGVMWRTMSEVSEGKILDGAVLEMLERMPWGDLENVLQEDARFFDVDVACLPPSLKLSQRKKANLLDGVPDLAPGSPTTNQSFGQSNPMLNACQSWQAAQALVPAAPDLYQGSASFWDHSPGFSPYPPFATAPDPLFTSLGDPGTFLAMDLGDGDYSSGFAHVNLVETTSLLNFGSNPLTSPPSGMTFGLDSAGNPDQGPGATDAIIEDLMAQYCNFPREAELPETTGGLHPQVASPADSEERTPATAIVGALSLQLKESTASDGEVVKASRRPGSLPRRATAEPGHTHANNRAELRIATWMPDAGRARRRRREEQGLREFRVAVPNRNLRPPRPSRVVSLRPASQATTVIPGSPRALSDNSQSTPSMSSQPSPAVPRADRYLRNHGSSQKPIDIDLMKLEGEWETHVTLDLATPTPILILPEDDDLIVAHDIHGHPTRFGPIFSSEARRGYKILSTVKAAFDDSTQLAGRALKSFFLKFSPEQAFMDESFDSSSLMLHLKDHHLVTVGCIPPFADYESALERLLVRNDKVLNVDDQSNPSEFRNRRLETCNLKQLLDATKDNRIISASGFGTLGLLFQNDFSTTETIAYAVTDQRPYCKDSYEPSQTVFPTLREVTFNVRGAMIPWHIEPGGFGVKLDFKTGRTLLMVAGPSGIPRNFGKLGAIDIFSQPFSWEARIQGLEVEALVVDAGTRVMLRPNVPFALYTIDSSIFYSTRFYAAPTMQDTLFGIIHSFILGPALSNFKSSNDHSSSYFIRRIGSFYHDAFVDGLSRSKFYSPHLPNLRSPEGVLNFFALCALVFLMNVLDRRTYILPKHLENCSEQEATMFRNSDVNEIDAAERTRCCYVRGQVVDLLNWYFSQHVARAPDPDSSNEISQEGLFASYLARTALGIYQYKLRAGIQCSEFKDAPGIESETTLFQIRSSLSLSGLGGLALCQFDGWFEAGVHISSLSWDQPLQIEVLERPSLPRMEISNFVEAGMNEADKRFFNSAYSSIKRPTGEFCPDGPCSSKRPRLEKN